LSGSEIIKVELTNLKEILQNSYAVNKVSFRVENQIGNLLIETSNSKNVSVVLYDRNGNKIKDLYSGRIKTGINFLQFEIPKQRLKEFILKVFMPERTEAINFRL